MKLTEAWRLSSLPYREVVYRSLAQERNRMWWGSFGRKESNKDSADDSELTECLRFHVSLCLSSLECF
jgi:hypothetical protein